MNESIANHGVEQGPMNPFPATAVARLAKDTRELLTVETPALRAARSCVQNFLQQKDDTGRTVCIVGEYGTGKTHLALEILNIIQETRDRTLHPFYLDAPSDNFLALYRKRFLPKLSFAEVQERVDECYADIVAEELKDDPVYGKVAVKLRSREIEASEVIQSLGLMESRLQRHLQKRLKTVTEDACFAKALTLLQQPEFSDQVWSWFQGTEPSDALRERGVTEAIDTDARSLETIGVLAFLFGQQGHRFILLIDELEKVFSSTEQHFPDRATMLAFKKLFEAIGKTKALLVLSGLPDFYEALPDDARERISKVIKPSPLTDKDVIAYIKAANKKGSNRAILKPFSNSTSKYVSEITGGNARQVIRICYHAFQMALAEGSNVTRVMIEEVAHEQFGGRSEEDIVPKILQVIEQRGWLFENGRVFEKGNEKQTADLWLPVGESGDGIAITHVQDIFSRKSLEGLAARTSLLKKEDRSGLRIASVLVVGGFLAENLMEDVDKAFNRVVVFRFRRFRDDLDAALTGLRVQIEQRTREDNLVIVRRMVERLDRQYRQLIDIIENKLPTKQDLYAVAQLSQRTSIGTGQAQDIVQLVLSDASPIGDRFKPVVSSLEETDSMITAPIYRFTETRMASSDVAEIRSTATMRFYLVREMVYLLYNLATRPKGAPGSVVTHGEFDLAELCIKFADVFSELSISGYGSQDHLPLDSLLERANLATDSYGIRRDRRFRQLDRQIRSLVEDVFYLLGEQRTDRILRYDSWTGPDGINIASPSFELNSLFVGTYEALNTVYGMIREATLYATLTKRGRVLWSVETVKYLSLFFFLKRMTVLYMEVIDRSLGSGFPFRSKQVEYLGDAMQHFEAAIFSPSRMLRSTSFVRDLIKGQFFDSCAFSSSHMEAAIAELYKHTRYLPRRTFEILRSMKSFEL